MAATDRMAAAAKSFTLVISILPQKSRRNGQFRPFRALI
jgi:hypothetical protein